jgi:hypothetical protein
MTTIDPRLGTRGPLQARSASVRQREAASGAASGTAAAASRTPAATQAGGAALLQRIRAIGADDPDRRQKAVRLFLESELLREFGDEMLTDPQFGTMLASVQQQMVQDPQTAAAVDALADLLIARSAA